MFLFSRRKKNNNLSCEILSNSPPKTIQGRMQNISGFELSLVSSLLLCWWLEVQCDYRLMTALSYLPISTKPHCTGLAFLRYDSDKTSSTNQRKINNISCQKGMFWKMLCRLVHTLFRVQHDGSVINNRPLSLQTFWHDKYVNNTKNEGRISHICFSFQGSCVVHAGSLSVTLSWFTPQ